MASYHGTKSWSNESERMVVVRSDKCTYQVWIDSEEVTLRGPGVNETTPNDFDEFESIEDLGIAIVILFENGLWPKD